MCHNDNLYFIQGTYLVYRDNITAVNNGLKECSNIPTYLDQILLTIQAQELAGELSLDISDNIRYLTIDKLSSGNITIVLPITLKIERLELRSQDNWFILKSESNFFSKLPNLEHLDAENIVLHSLPSFTSHSMLTRIQVFNSTFMNETNTNVSIDVTSAFVSQLANLVLLSWKNSAILSLSADAFSGLGELTELNLEGNKIKEIKADQFGDLVKLKELDLSHNELTTNDVKNNAFANLIMVESLYMNSNPGFIPNLVFLPMFNLKYIYLQNNKYTSLDDRAFQQKRNLEQIHLFGDNMFDCSCDTTEWMYRVASDYGIVFFGGVCDTPMNAEGKPLTDATMYQGCENKLSYSCFGDVNCTTEQLCLNTLSGFECSCVGGFKLLINEFTNVQECVDEDECKINETCDQVCINQIGSFYCDCNEGFKLSGLRNCIDIDECAENKHNCTEDNELDDSLCENTIGGYECNCRPGFELQGLTSCLDLDECASEGQNSCLQLCINTQGDYVCSCRSGFDFNLTAIMVANSTMDNSNSMENSNSTMDNSTSTMNNTNSTMDNSTSTMNNTNNTNNTVVIDPSKVVDVRGNKGIPCVDEDECADGTHQCEHNCTNTMGFYNCSCREGFNLTNRFKCNDIDECYNETLCDATKGLRCNNTIGSFECICFQDYVVNIAMNTTCIPISRNLKVEEIAGIGIGGFVILSFLIVLLIITICAICRRSRSRVKKKTQIETMLESAKVKPEDTKEDIKNVVYNPNEIDNTQEQGANVYELDTSVTKEEIVVYGNVVDNSGISESIDKQLMESEFAAEGERATADDKVSLVSPEATNNGEYRDVLV